MTFSTHGLTKWRRLLLLRDCEVFGDRRVPVCVMCRRPHFVWALQAHHIRPKSLYPERAYELINGVMLCQNCHIGVVHCSNSFRDVTEIHNWKRHRPAFDRYVSLAAQRKFNEEHQPRLARYSPDSER